MTFGNYRIIRGLGAGGMGTVHEAEHVVLGHHVAIKVLHENHARHENSRERFLCEARALAQLRNPHIVDVTDFGQTDDGRIYFVMELLYGEMLGDLLMREGQLPLFRALTVLRQVAEALTAVHARGIVHRDLKPDNVHIERRPSRREVVRIVRDGTQLRYRVEPEGNFDYARIIDFGIAKFSELPDNPTEALGTPLYMAPEYIRGDPIDGRADIYGLGVLLFEVITGEPPFCGDTVEEIYYMHLNEPPPLPHMVRPDLNIPETVERVILKALSKNPARRQQTAQEFYDELQACFTDRFYARDARSIPGAIEQDTTICRHCGQRA